MRGEESGLGLTEVLPDRGRSSSFRLPIWGVGGVELLAGEIDIRFTKKNKMGVTHERCWSAPWIFANRLLPRQMETPCRAVDPYLRVPSCFQISRAGHHRRDCQSLQKKRERTWRLWSIRRPGQQRWEIRVLRSRRHDGEWWWGRVLCERDG